jgi:ribosomal protein S27AE
MIALSRRCATCAKPLPKRRGPGRPRVVCRDDHCEGVYDSGQNRKRCSRCGSRLARGRAAQRAAICGRCFVNLLDLAGGAD